MTDTAQIQLKDLDWLKKMCSHLHADTLKVRQPYHEQMQATGARQAIASVVDYIDWLKDNRH